MNGLFLSITLAVFSLSSAFAQPKATDSTVSKIPVAVRKTASAITPATYTGRQIMVGSGGGFTGFATTYYLLDNGQLFARRSRDSTFTPIGKQTISNTKRVFTAAETTCKIKTTKFNNPGNLYKFVRWRKGKQEYQVAWGGTGKAVPASYPKFYNSFMAMIPTRSRLN